MACSTLKRPCEIEDADPAIRRYNYPFALKRHSDLIDSAIAAKRRCSYAGGNYDSARPSFMCSPVVPYTELCDDTASSAGQRNERRVNFLLPPPSPPISPTETADTDAISPLSSAVGEDAPKFGLAETTAIVGEMVQRMETELRREFALCLSDQLSQQYDSFVSYNKDWVLAPAEPDRSCK